MAVPSLGRTTFWIFIIAYTFSTLFRILYIGMRDRATVIERLKINAEKKLKRLGIESYQE